MTFWRHYLAYRLNHIEKDFVFIFQLSCDNSELPRDGGGWGVADKKYRHDNDAIEEILHSLDVITRTHTVPLCLRFLIPSVLPFTVDCSRIRKSYAHAVREGERRRETSTMLMIIFHGNSLECRTAEHLTLQQQFLVAKWKWLFFSTKIIFTFYAYLTVYFGMKNKTSINAHIKRCTYFFLQSRLLGTAFCLLFKSEINFDRFHEE